MLLVVGGLLALRGKPAPPGHGAAPASTVSHRPSRSTPAPTSAPAVTAPTTTASTTQPPTTTQPPATTTAPPTTTTPPPPPPRSPASQAAARAPLSVLNNTTRPGLAEQAAEQFRGGGWQVVKVGNFTGRIPQTTVYFTPGSAAEERAAQALAAQFSGISRVLPRYAGLPDSVHGVIVVLAPDWP